MKKVIIGTAVAVCAFSIGIGAASAATPAVQGCVGSTISALATSSPAPGAFGHGVVDFAQNSDDPGIGHDIQALQAGVVPNDIVQNTCNGS